MKAGISDQYVAGFFDGEGSCIIRKRKDKRYKKGFQILVKITIHNKNKKVLERIKEKFGGNIYFHKRDKLWYIEIYRKKQIERFIISILPYSIIKKDMLIKVLKIIRGSGPETGTNTG